MKNILFISDGYGEDTIASFIINSLSKKSKDLDILAFPLVGKGRFYEASGITLAGPGKDMPSGGDLHSPERMLKDLRAGLLSLLMKQLFFLRTIRRSIDLVVAVGDLYPVTLAFLAGLKPVIFVGTAKSNWYYPYSFMEKIILKRYSHMVFPRDLITSEDLKKSGINSKYVGNTMMDCFHITGEDFGLRGKEGKIIGILPGSRDVAYRDFPVIRAAIEHLMRIKTFPLFFLAALSPSISPENLSNSEWIFYPSEKDRETVPGYLRKGEEIEIKLTQNRFGDVINIADIIIGQAGTGNEQAAGLGKPLVAFDLEGRGRLGWYRGRQKGLLGDALSVVKPEGEAIAEEVMSIFSDDKKRKYMSETGRKRIGVPGAVESISEEILKFL